MAKTAREWREHFEKIQEIFTHRPVLFWPEQNDFRIKAQVANTSGNCVIQLRSPEPAKSTEISVPVDAIPILVAWLIETYELPWE